MLSLTRFMILFLQQRQQYAVVFQPQNAKSQASSTVSQKSILPCHPGNLFSASPTTTLSRLDGINWIHCQYFCSIWGFPSQGGFNETKVIFCRWSQIVSASQKKKNKKKNKNMRAAWKNLSPWNLRWILPLIMSEEWPTTHKISIK